MLKRFTVNNFKAFQNELVFDLSNINDYQFNRKCIKSKEKQAKLYKKKIDNKICMWMMFLDNME